MLIKLLMGELPFMNQYCSRPNFLGIVPKNSLTNGMSYIIRKLVLSPFNFTPLDVTNVLLYLDENHVFFDVNKISELCLNMYGYVAEYCFSFVPAIYDMKYSTEYDNLFYNISAKLFCGTSDYFQRIYGMILLEIKYVKSSLSIS